MSISVATHSAPPATAIPRSFRAPARSDLEVVYAPEDLVGVDVVRRTESRTITNPDGTTRQEEVPVPRSPFGVSLGHGLVYDLNGNLALYPLLAFYAPIAAAVGAGFAVDPPGLFNETAVRRSGNTVSIETPGLMNDVDVTSGDNGVFIDRTGIGNGTTITRIPGGLQIDPDGLFNAITIKESGSRLEVGSGLFTVATLQWDDQGMILNPWGPFNATHVTRSGDAINVRSSGSLVGTTLDVEDHRIIVDRPGLFNSVAVERRGRSIIVNPSGVMDSTSVTPF